MKRYFIFMVCLNMLANITGYVPPVLIKHRFQGSVISIPIAAIIGTLVITLTLKALSQFPGQGMPEILQACAPRWVRAATLIYLALIWYSGGLISLLAVTDLTIRYFNPDTPLLVGIFMFILFTGSSAVLLKSERVMFFIEFILVVCCPMILVIFLKSFINRAIKWDDVWIAASYVTHSPSWTTVATATYVFSGYANMFIFNRCFQQPVKTKGMWMLGVLGFAILVTSFAIPVGFQGVDGVGDFVYPWAMTADSLRLELGITERVLHVYLLLYAGVAIANCIMHWHVAHELTSSVLPERMRSRHELRIKGIIVGIFAIVTFSFAGFVKEVDIQQIGVFWLNIRFGSEILMVAVLLYFAKRSRA